MDILIIVLEGVAAALAAAIYQKKVKNKQK